METATRCRPLIEFTDTISSNVTHVVVPDKTTDIADIDVLIAILRNIPIVTYECKYIFLHIFFSRSTSNSTKTLD